MGSGVEVLETEHGTSSGFDAAVILFNQIVQMLRDRSFEQPCYVLQADLVTVTESFGVRATAYEAQQTASPY
jgi:hypothetical protein